MKITGALPFALAALLSACANPPAANEPNDNIDDGTDKPQDRGPGELYGAELTEGLTVVDLEAAIADVATWKGRIFETRGIVRQSCQIRGCWMEVRAMDDVSSPSMTVRFKNYGFFVPLDARGSEVRFQGTMKVTTYSAAQVAELESEGGTFDNKNADGTATVVGFTATGVELWRLE